MSNYKTASVIEETKDILVIMDDPAGTAVIIPVSASNKHNLSGVKVLPNNTLELLYDHCETHNQENKAALKILANEEKIAELYNKLAAAQSSGTSSGGTSSGSLTNLDSFTNVSEPTTTLPSVDTGLGGGFTYVHSGN